MNYAYDHYTTPTLYYVRVRDSRMMKSSYVVFSANIRGSACSYFLSTDFGLMGKTRNKQALLYKRKKHSQFSDHKERLLRKSGLLQEQLQATRNKISVLEKSNAMLKRYVFMDIPSNLDIIIIFRNLGSSRSIGKGAKARQKLTSTYGCCTMPSEGFPARFNLSWQVSLLQKIPFSSLRLIKILLARGYLESVSVALCHLVKAFRTDEHLGCTFPIEAVSTPTHCHSNLPWFYGLSEHGSRRIIILSFHGVNGMSYTVHQALRTNGQDFLIEIDWKVILFGMVSALKHIHINNILHSDIKSDNIMIDNRSSIPQSILIDFGKGRFISDGKVYKLSLQEQRCYAIEHPHVAPDLRDGHCRQSQYSDVYSLGKVIKLINDKFFHIPFIASHASFCTQYIRTKRPSADDLFNSMQRMLMPSWSLGNYYCTFIVTLADA